MKYQATKKELYSFSSMEGNFSNRQVGINQQLLHFLQLDSFEKDVKTL